MLETRVEKIQRRQEEVELLREDYRLMEQEVLMQCKQVPKSPEMASIVQALSLEVEGKHVLDQTFTAGKATISEGDAGFGTQPLAISLQSDFDSVISVLQIVESMDRLVRVASIRMTRHEADADIATPPLETAIGLRAMFDVEDEP